MHIDSLSVDADFDALAYSYEKPCNAAHNNAVLGERSLWCAVIEQAFIDGGLIAGKNKEPVQTDGKDRDEALRWLLRNKRDFVYICTLAGISPFVIRHAAQLLVRA
jgi:hypothetical protein